MIAGIGYLIAFEMSAASKIGRDAKRSSAIRGLRSTLAIVRKSTDSRHHPACQTISRDVLV